MRFVPAGTSTAWPSTVSFGIGPSLGEDASGSRPAVGARPPCRPRPDVTGAVADVVVELRPELLDVRDVRPDRPVVKGANRAAHAPAGDVHDRVRVLGNDLPGKDPAGDLVDPAGALAAGRALPARLVGVEAGDHVEGFGD